MSEPLRGKRARQAIMVLWTVLAIMLAILGTSLFIMFIQALAG